MTLIAGDVAKNRIKFVKREGGVWVETTHLVYSALLRKPNHYQNHIQFIESWMLSKLGPYGNTYVLKQRNVRGVVVALYVLDPARVKPLVAESGEVFYQLSADNLSTVHSAVTVPASEIIHDRTNCLFHPLVGISPLFASALAATQGLNIQNNSIALFGNKSQPGGILTAPGDVSVEQVVQLREKWEGGFTGKNAGRIAILGNGMKFERMALTAEESELVDQLKLSAEMVCSTYHVPPYKIGVGPLPSHNNVQALNVEYYTQCLQLQIESVEVCLDDGLDLPDGVGTEVDVANLLRMDSAAQMDYLNKSAGILSPNEQRAEIGRLPVTGGESPMVQQQNYSLDALARRDASDDPFSKTEASPLAIAPPDNDHDIEAAAAKAIATFRKGLLNV
ncbi:phage portal protein [Asticcacaulis sp. ZE23SCel15]|uniref:phage portal protein n=1 Tax=Asticcacaulis sp. ZE23SCel15 TaxID=3059027 RepID=UPI00265E6754|nr:phage portal protein [Asticcacaulis sp. ZE23SCel15]WKL57246.1 phage portal protein [Asticcacaulis sp. ZE23SCel15]